MVVELGGVKNGPFLEQNWNTQTLKETQPFLQQRSK